MHPPPGRDPLHETHLLIVDPRADRRARLLAALGAGRATIHEAASAGEAFGLVERAFLPGGTSMVAISTDVPTNDSLEALVHRLWALDDDCAFVLYGPLPSECDRMAARFGDDLCWRPAFDLPPASVAHVIRRELADRAEMRRLDGRLAELERRAATGAAAAAPAASDGDADAPAERPGRLEETIAALRRDVQARIDAQRELERKHSALQEIVDELVVWNDQLVASRDSAEAADRAKTRFLTSLSHELRTPLGAILGFAESLRAGDLPGAQRTELIDIIHRNGEHLLELISDLLDLSTIAAGSLRVQLAPCRPRAIVRDAVEMLRPAAEHHGLALRLEIDEGVPERARTDGGRIRQVIANLVENAVRFTDAGTVTVAATFEDDRLVVRVADTGIGVSAEMQPRLFEPFAQADGATRRRHDGAGLGLAISREIARLLGGDVQLERTSPEGSTFACSFVLETADHVATPAAETTASAPADLHGVRILYVEDGPDNRRLVSFLLQKAGAIVKTVENGSLGVDEVVAAADAGHPYDVVLMDMQMPVMDGYEATRILRSLGHAEPIVALTAHAMAGERERCLDAGCVDFATKPIDRPSLLALVARHARPAPADAAS